MKKRNMSRNELSEATGISYNVLKLRLATGHNLEVGELRHNVDALGSTPQEILVEADSTPTTQKQAA